MPGEAGSSSDKQYVLSESEMALVLNMIAVVSKRGGFLPTEFKLVGEFWEKFSDKKEEPEPVESVD
jgi:hypothetical protein